jgi:hypothetical protein
LKYNYGAFLDDGGLFKIISKINTERNTRLTVVPIEPVNSNYLLTNDNMISCLTENSMNHLVRPIRTDQLTAETIYCDLSDPSSYMRVEQQSISQPN